MKKFTLFPIALLVVFLLAPEISVSQNQAATDNLYYVVIGAFASPRNANEFTESAKKKGLEARYYFVAHRKLNYVYILEVPEKSEAVNMAVKLQTASVYSDTWVYQGLLGDNPIVIKFEKPEPVIEEKTEEQSEEKQPIEKLVAVADGSKSFIFKLRSIDTGETVVGDIDIFDGEITKGRKVVSYRGNDAVRVMPINKSGNLAVVCDVFGYRKVQLPVNFNDPKLEDAVSMEDGNVVVTFDLVRLKKGDQVIMYNVYFFNHAAIMRPESRSEINELYEMLKNSPTSRVRIHGHTNGNDSGKIITIGTSKDYFALKSENIEDKGSAVKLSEERAICIQSYLVIQGIDIKRMELKAWGGKTPIYDKDHSMAQANVRVEIEIIAE